MKKGFATMTVFLVVTALMIMALSTSYVVRLRCCLDVHGRLHARNNNLISSTELYVKYFVIENWTALQAESASPDTDIVINDFFRPHLSGYVVTLSNWKIDTADCRIQFLLSCRGKCVAHRSMRIKKGDATDCFWRSECV